MRTILMLPDCVQMMKFKCKPIFGHAEQLSHLPNPAINTVSTSNIHKSQKNAELRTYNSISKEFIQNG